MFLFILRRKVIDTPAENAVPAVPAIPEVVEVIEDLTANPPIAGVAPVAAVPEVPEVPAVREVSHLEPAKVWVERDSNRAAKLIAQNNELDVHEIQLSDTGVSLVPTLSVVSEKPGGRRSAPAREMIEIVNAAGDLVGSHVLEL